MLTLRGRAPVAQGHKRFVIQHPTDPDMLVKVMQPDVVEERWGARSKRPWFRKRGRYGQYVSLRRELSEYLAAAVKFPEGVPVLQKLGGIVETDQGVGIVVEKLVGRDGGLAPTLTAVARKGVTPELLQKLDEFEAELIKYNIVVGKLHANNLVLAVRDGKERFVAIDGYGEAAFIPVHTWSARINAAHTRSRLRRLKKKLQERGIKPHQGR